ncbi:uncharacterized protein LOC129911464 isoform X2 [Episyrphus balteatus]|uniref:uncharacterized protein LOC129911464 isoform X2 n=1 Tax=Episyrphus balteatus TaxID=286459 RepID=UPI00248546EF|nr:uncharacterized protein LOC129911464 isoform X2 [Episyrphus balteatus]
MDTANCEAFNFLYISPDKNDDIQEFIKIAATLIKQNKKVLLFTRQHVDMMPALAGLNKEQMQHFIISYHSDINTIIGKLLELHDWTILPDFVVLNLNSFYNPSNDEDENGHPKFDKVCFCISTLLNYMRFLKTKKCSKSVMAAFNEIAALQNKVLN